MIQIPIQLVFCTDMYSFPGLMVTLNSIIKNCSNPSLLEIYVLGETSIEKNCLNLFLSKYFSSCKYFVEVIQEHHNQQLQSYKNFCKDNIHCRNVMNFSRFFLPHIFPSLKYFIYIDTDFLFLDDICKLWSLIDGKNNFYAIPSEMSNKIIYSLVDGAEERLKLSKRRPFNAGLSIIDADKWRRSTTTEELIGYMNNDIIQKSFRFGTQPLLNYKFQETYGYLPSCWNRIAYDYSEELKHRTIDLFLHLNKEELINEGISAIHFAGCPKPWVGIHSIGGGNWPSAGERYSMYYPYIQVIKFNSSVRPYIETPIYQLFVNCARDFFGIDVICYDTTDRFVEKQTAKFVNYFTESNSESTSTRYCVLISKTVVLNNTDISEPMLYSILENTNKEDGVYLLSDDTSTVKITYKNLFEDLLNQFENKNVYKKEYLEKIITSLICFKFLT